MDRATRRLRWIAIAAALLGCATALTQDEHPPLELQRAAPELDPTVPMIADDARFEDLDNDRDGYLSRTEVAEYAMFVAQYAELAANGVLGEREFETPQTFVAEADDI